MLRFVVLAACLSTVHAAPLAAQQPATKELPARAPAEPLDAAPHVSARAWVVVDARTGKALGAHNASEPRAIASTTKIMTAHVVLQLAQADPKVLDEVVTASERAAGTTGSSARLKAGDQLPVRELLYGLLLPSGNDAAAVLAEHFGPRFEAAARRDDKPSDATPVGRFVAEMNRRAAALSLSETSYLDPHGLGKNQSSARDLAALARHALEDERFRDYVRTRRHEYQMTGVDGMKREVVWANTNRLLGIEGYDGVKTGTTSAAGSCLVGRGKRGADEVLVVVLGCPNDDARYADARNLFVWAWRKRAAGGL